LGRETIPAPEGRKIPGIEGSAAPLGLIPQTQRPPTAHAVGYRLSALRAWDSGRSIRGAGRRCGFKRRALRVCEGAEHRQSAAPGISRGLLRAWRRRVHAQDFTTSDAFTFPRPLSFTAANAERIKPWTPVSSVEAMSFASSADSVRLRRSSVRIPKSATHFDN